VPLLIACHRPLPVRLPSAERACACVRTTARYHLPPHIAGEPSHHRERTSGSISYPICHPETRIAVRPCNGTITIPAEARRAPPGPAGRPSRGNPVRPRPDTASPAPSLGSGGDLGFDELRGYFASSRAVSSDLRMVREHIIVDGRFLARAARSLATSPAPSHPRPPAPSSPPASPPSGK